jgi:preprotein translocase subunit YajC
LSASKKEGATSSADGWFGAVGVGRLSRFGAIKGAKMAVFGISIPLEMALQAPASSPLGGAFSFLPILLIIVIFYFLMIMPAQRRQKKTAEMLRNLKNGDKVITNGGIYGTIVGLEDDAVQLRIAEQVKIKISRNAVAGLQPEPKGS